MIYKVEFDISVNEVKEIITLVKDLLMSSMPGPDPDPEFTKAFTMHTNNRDHSDPHNPN